MISEKKIKAFYSTCKEPVFISLVSVFLYFSFRFWVVVVLSFRFLVVVVFSGRVNLAVSPSLPNDESACIEPSPKNRNMTNYANEQ